MLPFLSRRRRRSAREVGGFAATFARHPARPRTGLIPGRRVWVTIFTAATLTCVGVLAVPLLSAIDLGGAEGPEARPVADRASVAQAPAAAPKPAAPKASPSPTEKKTEKPAVVVTKTVEAEPKKRKKKEPRLPQGPVFPSVTGVMLRNLATKMCGDVPGFERGGIGGKIQVSVCNSSPEDNQKWDLVVDRTGKGPNGESLFAIRNSKDGLCFDLGGYAPVSATTEVIQGACNSGADDNQMWYLDERGAGRFWIRNAASAGLCLDVSNNGGPRKEDPLTVYPCSADDDHLWRIAWT